MGRSSLVLSFKKELFLHLRRSRRGTVPGGCHASPIRSAKHASGDDVGARGCRGVTLAVLDQPTAPRARAKDRSTTQCRGNSTKPRLASGSLTTGSALSSMRRLQRPARGGALVDTGKPHAVSGRVLDVCGRAPDRTPVTGIGGRRFVPGLPRPVEVRPASAPSPCRQADAAGCSPARLQPSCIVQPLQQRPVQAGPDPRRRAARPACASASCRSSPARRQPRATGCRRAARTASPRAPHDAALAAPAVRPCSLRVAAGSRSPAMDQQAQGAPGTPDAAARVCLPASGHVALQSLHDRSLGVVWCQESLLLDLEYVRGELQQVLVRCWVEKLQTCIVEVDDLP